MVKKTKQKEKPKKEGGTTFKVIQKLTGKLAQRIRKFNSEDDMDPNDVKYIINSILSALDVDLLDDDDLEEIISRLNPPVEKTFKIENITRPEMNIPFIVECLNTNPHRNQKSSNCKVNRR